MNNDTTENELPKDVSADVAEVSDMPAVTDLSKDVCDILPSTDVLSEVKAADTVVDQAAEMPVVEAEVASAA